MGRVEFACPSCSQRLTADAAGLARKMRCARCGAVVRPLDALERDEPLPALPVEEEEPAADETAGEAAGEASAPGGVFSLGALPALGSAPVEPAPLAANKEPERDPDDVLVRGKGGTIVLDTAPPARPRTQALREAAAPWLAELGIAARAFVDAIGRRLTGRRGPVVSLAAPALLVLLLVLLALARAPLWRWLWGLGAFALGWAVVAAAAAVGLSRRLPPERGQPLGSARARLVAGGALAAAALVAGAVTGAVALASSPAPDAAPAAAQIDGRAELAPAASSAAMESGPAADEKLDRKSRDPVAGGTLIVPKSFHSRDGSFDLLLHFHSLGTAVVAESVEAAELDAVVHVMTLERGRDYWEKFEPPSAFGAHLEQIRRHVEKKGLRDARIRRVAIASWSTGSGAVSQILAYQRNLEQLDAVLILEGLHAGWVDERRDRRVDPNKIATFVRLAQMAKDGKKLFAVTHSKLETRDYADSRTVANAVLEAVGVERKPEKGAVRKVKLASAERIAGGAPASLEAESAAGSGSFHVLGYQGNQPEHHRAHLLQMSATVLPLLAKRWGR